MLWRPISLPEPFHCPCGENREHLRRPEIGDEATFKALLVPTIQETSVIFRWLFYEVEAGQVGAMLLRLVLTNENKISIPQCLEASIADSFCIFRTPVDFLKITRFITESWINLKIPSFPQEASPPAEISHSSFSMW